MQIRAPEALHESWRLWRPPPKSRAPNSAYPELRRRGPSGPLGEEDRDTGERVWGRRANFDQRVRRTCGCSDP
eukprot:2226410-Alexandrium_andersonii.AAC.1